ncbi:hypothetical protein [Vibrio sp. Isolate24]|uniref:hypothetical protein n=1 Tax=Vibrio sp. Isolate24 TaxID=2908534 RepID=UPI001EFDC729|nr:hypothetical protein [Vibrio sp. Isolate24]MCG9680857.1 hypothetical protein [Vibrio sp. Isolate24]
MTRFEKAEKIVTLSIAVISLLLTLNLYIKNWQDSQPTFYSSYSISPEAKDPQQGKTNRVRMDVFVSNTGKEEIEIPPVISITVFDTVTREERSIRASLLSEKGEELPHIIPTTLKQGSNRVYRTTYEDIQFFFGPHISTIVQMWSGDDLYIAPTEPPKNPEGIKVILDSEIFHTNLGDIKSSPAKFYKVGKL